jgi:hypothetical protein
MHPAMARVMEAFGYEAWKLAMWEAGCKLPAQMPDGRLRCFCGAQIDIAGTEHIAAVHSGKRETNVSQVECFGLRPTPAIPKLSKRQRVALLQSHRRRQSSLKSRFVGSSDLRNEPQTATLWPRRV